MDVGGDGAEKVVCFAVGDVSCADCLLDFSRHEEVFEFCGKGGSAGGDVDISYDEDEDHCEGCCVLSLFVRGEERFDPEIEENCTLIVHP